MSVCMFCSKYLISQNAPRSLLFKQIPPIIRLLRINPDRIISPAQRLSQLLKGAVVVTLCQNEADVKCQMDIWGKSPLEIILLPHFVRGSRQLLLYMTDTFDNFCIVNGKRYLVNMSKFQCLGFQCYIFEQANADCIVNSGNSFDYFFFIFFLSYLRSTLCKNYYLGLKIFRLRFSFWAHMLLSWVSVILQGTLKWKHPPLSSLV